MPDLWCNGRWQDDASLSVSPADRGWLHGLGLFETLLALDGRPCFLQRHIERISHACRRLGWTFPDADLHAVIAAILVRNSLDRGRARIRITLSAGSGPFHDHSAGGDRLLIVTAAPAPDEPGEMSAAVSPWKLNEHSPLAGLKSTSYAEHLLALAEARQRGFDEALLSNSSGHLCEAATANLFLVTGGILFTPSLETGCLPGITRALVLEAAAAARIPLRECLVTPRDLRTADEVFLTSSIRGVTPLTRIDSRAIPPGPLTARLRTGLQAARSR